ncbi:MAG: two-component system sensor histidine kinase NtrB [Planctomycetota bacterium]|jgi:PAS domain S-box-containing protein
MADVNHAQQQAHSDSALDDHYRLVCEQASVALISTDTDLRIRLWNSAAGQIFGASAAEMVGTSILPLIPAEKREAIERVLQRVIQQREVKRFQFTQRDREGSRRHLAACVTPIVRTDGATQGLTTCITDITSFAELLQEAVQGRKMTALGELAGAVAHHFNNILGGLVTSVDFALAANDPTIEHRVLEQTARSLARASRLMDYLSAFAEGDHRPGDLGDLTEVILQAMDLVEPELAGAKIKLELNEQALPVTAVPRQQLLTVILNLIHNAVDAMPDGGVLRIDIEHVGDCCLLRFTDNGCGMDEERLDRIFEPFYSTKSVASDSVVQATGFGLAVVHGVLQEIGGKISVASQPGKGTTVEVRVPCGAEFGKQPGAAYTRGE